MNRLLGSVLLLAATAAAADAHFLFVVPRGGGSSGADAVFSDALAPDRAELLERVKQTRFSFVRGKGDSWFSHVFPPAQPQLVEVKADKVKQNRGEDGNGSLRLDPPFKVSAAAVIGTCPYGVVRRGSEAFLLMYYARGSCGPEGNALELPAKIHPLQVLVAAVKGDKATVKVLWQDKPLKDAEVSVVGETATASTDARGTATLALPKGTKANTPAGVRARHFEDRAGEHGGKKYSTVRHYSTTVFMPAAAQ